MVPALMMVTIKKWLRSEWLLLLASLNLLLAGCAPSGPEALEQGEKLIRQGKFPAAIRRLEIATQKLPQNPQAWNHLGLAYHKNNEPDKAAGAYVQALKLDRNLAPAYYNLGQLQSQQTNVTGAIQSFTTFTRLQPESPNGWMKLGVANRRAHNLEQAEQNLLQARNLDPTNPAVYNELGLLELEKERPKSAMQYFARSVNLNTNYAPAVLNLAIVAHHHTTNLTYALGRYREYLAIKPEPPSAEQVKTIVSRIEDQLNRRRSQAATATETEKSEGPSAPAVTDTSPFTKTNQSQTLAQTESQKSAEDSAEASQPTEAEETNPPSRLHIPPLDTLVVSSEKEIPAPRLLAMGPEPDPAAVESYFLLSSPAEAATPIPDPPEESVEFFPMVTNLALSADLEASLAPILSEGSTLTTAESETSTPRREALRPGITPLDPIDASTPPRVPAEEPKSGFFSKLNPMNWFRSDEPEQPTTASPTGPAGGENEAPLTITLVDEPAPLVENTQPVFDRYDYREITLPEPGSRAEALPYFVRGVREQKRNRYADARKLYDLALQWDPTYFDALYNKGICALLMDDNEAALAAFESALALQPDHLKARYNFALAMKREGYPLDAAEQLNAVLEKSPDDPRVHLALGNLFAQTLNRPNLARQHYEKVLDEEPSHPQATEIRYWLSLHGQP